MNSIYTQKDLMSKVKPRHTGGYRLDLQINNVRKTFYSSKAGDAGRRECAKKPSHGLTAVVRPQKAILSQQMQFFRISFAIKKPLQSIFIICATTTKTTLPL